MNAQHNICAATGCFRRETVIKGCRTVNMSSLFSFHVSVN